MCKCRYAEFVCSCNKNACPHNNPTHSQYHTSQDVWQVDHFGWKYCSSVLLDHPSSPDIAPPKTNTNILKRALSTSTRIQDGTAKVLLLQTLKLCGDRNETDETVYGRRCRSTDEQPRAEKKKSPSPPRPPRPVEDVELRSMLSGTNKVDDRRFVTLDCRALAVSISASDDPRHGDEIPDCDRIVYEGFRIKWVCGFCEDYWIGRTGLI